MQFGLLFFNCYNDARSNIHKIYHYVIGTMERIV